MIADTRLVTMTGVGDRPACVLLPGVGGSPGQYLGLAARLASRYDCYAVRAAGLAPGERVENSVPAMADSALAMLDRAGLRPQLVLGWSFGGVLGWELCVRLAALGRLPRLVLVDSSPFDRPIDPVADAELSERILGMLPAAADPERRMATVVAAQLAAMAGYRAGQPYAGPTLALACGDAEFGDRRDDLARWRELAPRLTTGRLTAGHFEALATDRLDELAGRLTDFLAEQAPDTGAAAGSAAGWVGAQVAAADGRGPVVAGTPR